MKFNFYTMTALTIIFFFTIVAIGKVGSLPDCEPQEWWSPVAVFLMLFIPFMLGYLGKE